MSLARRGPGLVGLQIGAFEAGRARAEGLTSRNGHRADSVTVGQNSSRLRLAESRC